MTPPPDDLATPATPAAGIPEFPWMPLYVDALLALAAVLTPRQLGALFRLKAHAWRQTPRCTLPDLDPRLATIAGLDDAAWAQDGPVLREYLTAIDGGRLLDEALLALYVGQVNLYQLSQKRKAAGSVGGKHSASKREAGARPHESASKGPSNRRSNPPSKAGDLVEVLLTSVVVGSTALEKEKLKGPEANAEANRQANPPTNLERIGGLAHVDWRNAIDPARAARERTRQTASDAVPSSDVEVGSTAQPPAGPAALLDPPPTDDRPDELAAAPDADSHSSAAPAPRSDDRGPEG